MDETTPAIVLRKTPYTDSAAIVSTYTLNHGKMAFMVRGLGKKGGKNAAVQPLTRVEIGFRHRPNRNVQMSNSIRLTGTASPDFSNPIKSSMALFLAEVIFKALREESADEKLYAYLDAALVYFEENPPNPVFHLQLMAKLTRLLGFFPAGSPDANKPYFDLQNGIFTADKNASLHVLKRGETNLFYQLTTTGFETPLQMSRAEKQYMLHTLATYYRLHLEGFGELKSLPILMELFA